MGDWRDYLFLEEDELRRQCEEEIFRASGPGGQHRNKVSSAVRLKHDPSGQVVTASERRSQHENRHIAVKRMRMAIALNCRIPCKAEGTPLPSWFNDCLSPVKNAPANAAPYRLSVSVKNPKFWPIAAMLLDLLAGEEAKLGPVSGKLGVSSSNLTKMFKSERHLFGMVQNIRKAHNQKPLS